MRNENGDACCMDFDNTVKTGTVGGTPCAWGPERATALSATA